MTIYGWVIRAHVEGIITLPPATNFNSIGYGMRWIIRNEEKVLQWWVRQPYPRIENGQILYGQWEDIPVVKEDDNETSVETPSN
jgi:hypothetical protein